MQQLTINFESGLADRFATCRECVSERIYHQSKPQKIIAADMDYSPSILSRKLAQSPTDNSRFTLDDLEKFIEVTGDTKPILYLVEKFLAGDDEIERLKQRIEELEMKKQLKAVE